MASVPTTAIGLGLTSGMQLAYLTNNTQRAIEGFEGSAGIGPWVTREACLNLVDGPEGTAAQCRLLASFAYMNGRMFEIIEPVEEALPIFPLAPADALSVQPHHVGAFMDDADTVVAEARAANLPYHRFTGGRGDIVFVDTRSVLGHWTEIPCFAPTIPP